LERETWRAGAIADGHRTLSAWIVQLCTLAAQAAISRRSQPSASDMSRSRR
jgi:hypothetical protein